MAQTANTYETYDAVGNREELADRIYQISPHETPATTLIGRKSISSKHPEWLTQELDTPVTTNSQIEGDSYTYDAITPATQVGNYAQIARKAISITRTQEKASKAGRKSEMSHEIARKGVALRTDMEVSMLSNNASSAGSGNGASNRVSGGLRAWLSTNDSLGAGGASGGFNTGTGIVDAATNGTQRAFTKELMDEAILSAYNAGGTPSVALMSPYVKTVFSTFMTAAGIVPLRENVTPGAKRALIGSAEVYVSDFGSITMLPNRQMARAGTDNSRNVFFIDPKMVSLGTYRDIMIDKPASTGDDIKRVIISEYSLCVNNEAACAVVADVFGTSPTT